VSNDIDNPDHYIGDIECIDAMKQQSTPEEFRGYLRLTAFKYLWRMGRKEGNPPAKDAGKARWFIDKLEEELRGAFACVKDKTIEAMKQEVQDALDNDSIEYNRWYWNSSREDTK
jgi:hypothetical protein